MILMGGGGAEEGGCSRQEDRQGCRRARRFRSEGSESSGWSLKGRRRPGKGLAK